MKKAFLYFAVAMTCSFIATSSQASRDEYYEGGERYEHGGYYGGEYGGRGYYEGKFYGIVESIPPGGILGMWRIRGREVLVTERTFIKDEYGRIGVGAQVEVKGSGNPFTAYEIEVKSGGRMPAAAIPPPAFPPPAALISFSGPVEVKPQGTLFGMWKIGGKEVVITDRTIIKQQNGPLAPGAQVEVKGGSGIPFIATEIEVKSVLR